MEMNEVIIIGRINKGKQPIGGETGKNQVLIQGLAPYCKVYGLDFYRNKQRPWIFLQTLWTLLVHHKATLILSSTASNVYPLMRLHKLFNSKRNVIHWCIGGKFADYVSDGKYSVPVLNSLDANIVESDAMRQSLVKSGVNNSIHLPNFKTIPYKPSLDKRLNILSKSGRIRFVYLSRVMKVKGADLILQAVEYINNKYGSESLEVDFYGLIEEGYDKEFLAEVKKLPNVQYKGMLNLKCSEGYDTLSTYHAMLFPTYHSSEGFAGVFIDSFIAGLPVITTNWHVNPEIVDDGINGVLIQPENIDALISAMTDVIEGNIDIDTMSKNAQSYAEKYNVKNVITSNLLKQLKIIK